MSISTIHEIYGLLFSGKTLQLHFASPTEADTFRVALHKYKRSQEQVLIAADLLADEELTRMSFEIQRELKEVTGFPLTVTLSFKSKSKTKTYEILVLPDEEEGDGVNS